MYFVMSPSHTIFLPVRSTQILIFDTFLSIVVVVIDALCTTKLPDYIRETIFGMMEQSLARRSTSDSRPDTPLFFSLFAFSSQLLITE
jgi:hypothetical protein